jgi:diapolycopene oxygenase
LSAKKTSIVVGSGIAGLAAAIRLRVQGFDVQVFEANAFYGGKLHSFEKDGYRFDFGPSLFTMPQFVSELFQLAGEDMDGYLKYKKLDTLCNYFYPDGTEFHASADRSEFVDEAVQTLKADRNTLNAYLDHSSKMYQMTAPFFLHKPIQKWRTWTQKGILNAFLASPGFDVFKSMNKANEQRLKNQKLVQLFNRYATYNGSNPYQAPGILNVVPCLEFDYGAFAPEGGMKKISEALFRLAEKMGVVFHLNTPVEEIKIVNGKAVGVRTADYFYEADVTVSNADMYSTYKHLLPSYPAPNRKIKQERSSSALVFYWGISKTFDNLDVHNILFSSDYREEFDALFKRKELQKDPTVYINITSKYVPSDAPAGHENWFTMINAPHEDGQDWESFKKEARKKIVDKINQALEVDIEKYITCETVTEPQTIESKTGSHLGSLYGTSSNNAFAAFLRHQNDGGPKNLYFCGGSVHPGGGIPLCLLSAKITTDLIHEQQQ